MTERIIAPDILYNIPSPAFVADKSLLRRNLEILRGLKERTGCKILLAQKAFSMFNLYPFIGEYLDGTAASGLFEARLGAEEMGGESHVYSPAYREDEFAEILNYLSHIVFNSAAQWERFGERAKTAGKSCGLRINPECSTQPTDRAIYDSCTVGSRLGATAASLDAERLHGLDGLHFHTLCEQNSDALAVTLTAVEEKFGYLMKDMKWLNFGGGHHITREDYDMVRLEACINRTQEKYSVQVYLEPGEAVVLNAGYLVAIVLDVMFNGINIAILDTSAACHMPDVLEVPYRPGVIGAGEPGEKPFTYRLGGPTCLAGDIIGDYSFNAPLKPGDRLVFTDMALYTMVKTNTFNGMNLPSIAVLHEDGNVETVKAFGYEDFKNRLS